MRINSALSTLLLLRLALADVPSLTTSQQNDPIQFDSLPTPFPAELLNTNIWSPISTITNVATATSTPSPDTQPQPPHQQPLFSRLSSYLHHTLLPRLLPRQIPGQIPAPAAATIATQISPITTAVGYSYPGGTPVAYTVIYTQLFTTPLDVWTPAIPGVIGMGTITGEIGVIRTEKVKKRAEALQTQVPVMAAVSVEGQQPQQQQENTQQEVATPKVVAAAVPSQNNAAVKKGPAVDSRTVKAGSAMALVLAVAVMVVA